MNEQIDRKKCLEAMLSALGSNNTLSHLSLRNNGLDVSDMDWVGCVDVCSHLEFVCGSSYLHRPATRRWLEFWPNRRTPAPNSSLTCNNTPAWLCSQPTTELSPFSASASFFFSTYLNQRNIIFFFQTLVFCVNVMCVCAPINHTVSHLLVDGK